MTADVMRRGVKGRCPTVLTVLSALLSGPEPRDMSQWHWSSVTPSDLRGQKETQDTEGSLGRKRDALTALSVPYSLFCLKDPAGSASSATPRENIHQGLG